jgi:hypothetical protein
MRRLIYILLPFVFSALLWWAYEASRLPAGIESKGEASEFIPWISLAGSILSLVTGIVTLTLEIFKLRQLTKRSSAEGDG